MSSRTPYVDPDGDGIEVETTPISVRFFRTGGGDYAGLDRDAVLRLHAALGEWLYPVHTPEWANKSLIEQMIERAVKDQVAAVLPLHLKPVATCAPELDAEECTCTHDASAHGPIGCTAPYRLGSVELICRCRGRVSDPEPHDVGHAEEPADHGRLMSELPRRTRPRPICVSCGHGWGEHTAGICWGTAQTPEGVGCTCTRERPA